MRDRPEQRELQSVLFAVPKLRTLEYGNRPYIAPVALKALPTRFLRPGPPARASLRRSPKSPNNERHCEYGAKCHGYPHFITLLDRQNYCAHVRIREGEAPAELSRQSSAGASPSRKRTLHVSSLLRAHSYARDFRARNGTMFCVRSSHKFSVRHLKLLHNVIVRARCISGIRSKHA